MLVAIKSIGSTTINRYVIVTNPKAFNTQIYQDRSKSIGLLSSTNIVKIAATFDLLLVFSDDATLRIYERQQMQLLETIDNVRTIGLRQEVIGVTSLWFT